MVLLYESALAPVFAISDYRVPHVGQLNANLVFATRFQLYFQQLKSSHVSQYPVAQTGLLAVGFTLTTDAHHAVTFVLP